MTPDDPHCDGPAVAAGMPAVARPLPGADRYRGQPVALLTQHGKERVIGSVLGPMLGCRIERVRGYDTDLLGTFTREIPRAGTQIEAARRKARVGMELAGWPLGLASEGVFGPDPIAGMFPWNVEILLWIDDVRGLEVVGRAQGKANFAHLLTADRKAADTFARGWGFPDHHLVLRPEREDDPRTRKGIGSWTELEAGFTWAQAQSPGGLVFLESDVRAFANPTRQQNIRLAAQDLAAKLCSGCPQCGAPGFWIVERVPGLPCEYCDAPTQEALADVLGCVKCPHRETRERALRHADPARCDHCNP